MKTMTAEELDELERGGATVTPINAPRAAPAPAPLAPKADPLDGLVALAKSFSTGLEAAANAKHDAQRINELEEELREVKRAVQNAPAPAPRRVDPLPDFDRLIEPMVEEAVARREAQFVQARPAPIKNVEIIRRGRYIDKVKIGGRTVLFKRSQDLTLQSLEFVEP